MCSTTLLPALRSALKFEYKLKTFQEIPFIVIRVSSRKQIHTRILKSYPVYSHYPIYVYAAKRLLSVVFHYFVVYLYLWWLSWYIVIASIITKNWNGNAFVHRTKICFYFQFNTRMLVLILDNYILEVMHIEHANSDSCYMALG